MNIVKILIFCCVSILIFSPKSARSQNPIPFPMDETAKWNVHLTHLEPIPGPFPMNEWIVENRIYYFAGDSIIDGLAYKNLFFDKSYYKVSSPGIIVYSYHLLASFFRQEGSKVFCRNSNYECIIYDFGVNPGDTLMVHLNSYTIVEDTSSILINGISLRKISTYNPASIDHTHNQYIEGIGSVYGLTYQEAWLNSYGYSSSLICYAENGSPLFNPWNNENCNLTVDVKKYEANFNSLISPNPFTEMATLSLKNGKSAPYSIAVYGLNGKLLLKSSFIGSQPFILKKTDFCPGLCFFTIIDESGRLAANGKFIVQ